MGKSLLYLGRLILTLLIATSTVGCGRVTPSLPSPISTLPATLVSMLPTPPTTAVHGKILLHFSPADRSDRATLQVSGLDGNSQVLAEMARDPRAVAVSSNKRYVAFFTSDTESDGSLIVWDVQGGETLFQIPVPAEVSNSFRDALPMRYLAWSPDDQGLAVVMNRDLHLVSMAQREVRVLIRHREERYNLAGMVMGSVRYPSWTTEGRRIVFDAFAPPSVLTAGADHYRNVEYVDIDTGTTGVLLDDAQIVQRLTTSSEPKLIIRQGDERTVSLDLTTLELGNATPLPETQGPSLCDSHSNKCASIMSEQGENDLLRLELASQGSQVEDVRLADLGESASGCQFLSTLWNPDGDALLVTVGCAGRASLWLISMPDLEANRLIDWMDADTVILLSWFE